LLNNSVNEFLNAFGAGRSEVSISGISTKKLNYSLKTIQPLSELNTNSKELTFIQTGIASGNGGNGRRATINLGIGHRLLGAVRAAPATSLSIIVAWLSFLVVDCGLFCW
jgi:hypothetical protein